MDFGSVEVVEIVGVAEIRVCGFCGESGESGVGKCVRMEVGYIRENSTAVITCQSLFTIWVFERGSGVFE